MMEHTFTLKKRMQVKRVEIKRGERKEGSGETSTQDFSIFLRTYCSMPPCL